jgi:hypothetical protein
MVTDGQVRRLLRQLNSGTPLAAAARRAGMTDKTARQYRDEPALPSRRTMPRTYRTRIDPFAAVWAAVEERLRAEPRLLAKTLFDWLRREHPGQFFDSHRRTFERRVRQWRALSGPNRTIVFRQIHQGGDLGASDFTCMNDLGITISRQPFDHLVYHFVLTYSNWESVSVCPSESFEALSDGLQTAFWELGGVPRRHRSDSLTAAVNNLSATREFQTRYRDLLAHYGVSGQRINVRQAHENGDAESSHGHFKTAVDQALLLRGSRDFASRAEYVTFLQDVVKTRNAGRGDRFAEELAGLRELPDSRIDSCLKVRCRVDTGSLVHIHRNTYSVHSRLIGEWVEARLFADRVEIWYADRHVETRPRLVGRDKHAVHYRHVIDQLVRKPGAFANYAYRDDLFPTTRFRLAYDRFRDGRDDRLGTKEYLKILQHAAHDSEVAVDDALRVLLADATPLTAAVVIAVAQASTALPAPTAVVVAPPDLAEFDVLLHSQEEIHDDDANPTGHAAGVGADPCVGAIDPTPARSASAGVPRPLPEPGGTRGEGELELPAVSGSVDKPRMRSPHPGPRPPLASQLPLGERQDLGPVPVAAAAATGSATTPQPPRRRLPQTLRERPGIRQAGFGKIARALCARRATGVARAPGLVHHLHLIGAGTPRGQTRPEARTLPEKARRLPGLDYRRPRLCATEPRGDGGALHLAGRALRTGQRAVDQQSGVLPMATDLQGPDDDRCGHRPLGASQCDRGTQRPELPPGDRKDDAQTRRRTSPTGGQDLIRIGGEF